MAPLIWVNTGTGNDLLPDLNQCRLTISGVCWHWPESNFIVPKLLFCIINSKVIILTLSPHIREFNVLNIEAYLISGSWRRRCLGCSVQGPFRFLGEKLPEMHLCRSPLCTRAHPEIGKHWLLRSFLGYRPSQSMCVLYTSRRAPIYTYGRPYSYGCP